MKKVRAVIVCLMAMVMLTGCLGLNMEMTVNEDGTCGYTLTYYYEQSTFELMNDMRRFYAGHKNDKRKDVSVIFQNIFLCVQRRIEKFLDK
mgnify:CR=1 FL=1